jgi:hypothetical protein
MGIYKKSNLVALHQVAVTKCLKYYKTCKSNLFFTTVDFGFVIL